MFPQAQRHFRHRLPELRRVERDIENATLRTTVGLNLMHCASFSTPLRKTLNSSAVVGGRRRARKEVTLSSAVATAGGGSAGS
jgi:hypothetical protein